MKPQSAAASPTRFCGFTNMALVKSFMALARDANTHPPAVSMAQNVLPGMVGGPVAG